MSHIKEFARDKKRMLYISLAVAVVISVTASAMTVDKFTDYNPPSTLVLDWYDYFKDILQNTPSSNNAVTEWPRWSAEYPYRALFLGGMPQSGNTQNHHLYMFMVYSKKPATTLFTFEYLSGEKASGQTGYIRAKINKTAYESSDDIKIVWINAYNMPSGSVMVTHPSFWTMYTSAGHTVGSSVYFDFDFYYECTEDHQQNTQLLDISGLRNVSAPYPYILTCDGHGTGGGASSGKPSTGGGSSGSGGSSANSNSNGDGGRHGWGNGEYGGGVDKDKIISGNDGGGYSSRSDMELSVPDDWKKPVEDEYNSMPSSEYVPEFSEYEPAQGDTGLTGEEWELPTFGGDGVSGSINGYKELIPNGEYGLIDFMAPMEEWLK